MSNQQNDEIQEQANEQQPGFIFPIICPYCLKELNLSMEFGLLPPKEEKKDETIIKEAETD